MKYRDPYHKKIQERPTIFSDGTPVSPQTLKPAETSNSDRRQDERRRVSRITVPERVPLSAEIETPDQVLRSVRCINLNAHGALLNFGEGKCPPLEPGMKLLLRLKLADETATIPGILRHRTDSRLGMSFQLEMVDTSSEHEGGLTNIIGILERAVNRRTTQVQKGESSQLSGATSSTRSSNPDPLSSTLTQTEYDSQDRRQQNRRRVPRIPILQGIPLRAEVVTPDRILREVRCINLSPHGALLDFGSGKCPPVELNAQVLVNVHIGSDTANIPSYVRHRTDNRLGVEFPFDQQPHLKKQEQGLGLILRTLERAVARRRSR